MSDHKYKIGLVLSGGGARGFAHHYKILDPEKAEELFMVGYDATKEKLKFLDLKSILAL